MSSVLLLISPRQQILRSVNSALNDVAASIRMIQIGNFSAMKQLIEIDASSPVGQRLLQILKNIEQKGVVSFLDEAQLKDSDWIRPGRPATDVEMESLIQEMNADTGEYSVEDVVSHVNEELQRWRTKDK